MKTYKKYHNNIKMPQVLICRNKYSNKTSFGGISLREVHHIDSHACRRGLMKYYFGIGELYVPKYRCDSSKNYHTCEEWTKEEIDEYFLKRGY